MNPDETLGEPERGEQASEDDLWFLPGPMEEEPDYLPPGPRAEPSETSVVADWAQAEAGCAARLARVAGRLGALDDRLRRGPSGWRHRFALIEAAELSWFVGDRVSPDRLALWIALRLSGAAGRLWGACSRWMGRSASYWRARAQKLGLADFLDRRDPENIADDAERFTDRADGWLALMGAARHLHPITRACLGFHLWSLAGLGQHGDRMEAAVTAGRIAASRREGCDFCAGSNGWGRGASCRRTSGRAVDPMAGRDGERMPRSNAAPRRSRNMVHPGRNCHVSVVWPYASGFARCIDRMALALCTNGRDPDRRQPCGCSAKLGLDGGAWADLRGDRPRAFQDVACGGLAAGCDHSLF